MMAGSKAGWSIKKNSKTGINVKSLYKYLLVLILVLPGASGLQARTVADSLRRLLPQVPYAERVDILNQLSRAYWNESIEKSIEYASQALEIARNTENSKGIADALNRLGNAEYMRGNHPEAIDFYFRSLAVRLEIGDYRGTLGSYYNLYLAYNNSGQPATAIEYVRKALDMSLESDNINDIARYSHLFGSSSIDQHDFESARPNLDRAVELYRQLRDTASLASSVFSLGRMYQAMHIYDRALELYFQAHKFYRTVNNRTAIASVKNNIGVIHKNLGNLELATRYYEWSLAIYREEGRINRGTASLLNNIGIIWYEKEDYKTALDYYAQALEMYEQIGDDEGMAVTNNNKGLVYTRIGDHDNAFDCFTKSAAINRKLGLDQSLANNYNNLGELYLILRNHKRALEYLDNALDLAIPINARSVISENYLFRSGVYRQMGDYETALLCYELFDSYQENIHCVAADNKIAELQVRYSRERQLSELDLLQRDNDLRHVRVERQKAAMLFYGSVALLAAIFALLMHGMYHYKKRMAGNLSAKNLELEHAYAELSVTEIDLKKLNNTKDKFFSIIAHDLKNPFNALLGFSETLNLNYRELSRDQVFTYIGIINKSASRLYQLLENLLTWSKCQTGNIIYKPEQLNLKQLSEAEIITAVRDASGKNISLITDIDKSISVFADRASVSIVLRNLLNNAVKFTHRGGKIVVSAKEKADHVEVSVTDDGVGIGNSEQKKLFSLDYNITTPGTDDEKGTGLGLILCKEFIEKNGGQLNIISKPGEGSTFIFTLPK
jgi:signal transduction histidine kinase